MESLLPKGVDVAHDVVAHFATLRCLGDVVVDVIFTASISAIWASSDGKAQFLSARAKRSTVRATGELVVGREREASSLA